MKILIPAKPEDVTPGWMTAVMQDACGLDGETVSGVEFEALGEGLGFAGQHFRFELSGEACEAGAPSTVFGKFSHRDPELREKLVGLYKREVQFYEQIAGQIDMRSPICYYGACDGETGESLLLLEALKGGRFGDFTAGCSIEDAERIVAALPDLHGPWWESQDLELECIQKRRSLDDPDELALWRDTQDHQWEAFCRAEKPPVPDSFVETREKLFRHGARIRTLALEGPQTLNHGDYHLNNLFLHDDGTVSVFDWQIPHKGPGAFDVVYFMSLCLDPDLRRQSEDHLIQLYCDSLQKRGVEYESDTFRRHFHTWLYEVPFPRIVAVTGFLDLSGERGMAVHRAAFDRLEAMIEDYPIDALLED